ncbi:MAG: TIGR03790 family protein [Opitutales bacterium]|jgi:uncharacterized protein (TIGR03790 family)
MDVCRRPWAAFRAGGMALAVFVSITATLMAASAPSPNSAPASAIATGPDAAHVVVVANGRSPDSVAVARYYMQRRGIPDKNLFLIQTSTDPDITWTEFVDEIFNPLRQQLTAAGWLDAYVTNQRDSEGRLAYVFFGHKIDFLVTCYGVPVRIQNDPARLAAYKGPPPRKEFMTNQAAVDSELALLAALDTPTIGLVANPLYKKLDPDAFTRGLVVRVARLDGPNAAAARGLVESALAGEARGLQGRAYLDFGGPHPAGDVWLEQTGQIIRQLGFDVGEDHSPGLFNWTERFDAPAIYFGWWSWDLAGPISDPTFHFPPGAIGFHIHSFSGEAIRDPNHRWVGPLVMRGIAATVGNVYEPYLEFTHNPQLFMAALAMGETTGEAAYYALPALSWQAIFVGDPLYRPLALDLPAQLARADTDPTPFSAYAVIRQMNLLEEQGQLANALATGQHYFARIPNIALCYALAQVEDKLGRTDDALKQLAWVVTTPAVSRDELGLVAEIARWAGDHHDPQLALDLYAKAIDAPATNSAFQQAICPEAIALAKQGNATDLVQRWTHDSSPPTP